MYENLNSFEFLDILHKKFELISNGSGIQSLDKYTKIACCENMIVNCSVECMVFFDNNGDYRVHGYGGKDYCDLPRGYDLRLNSSPPFLFTHNHIEDAPINHVDFLAACRVFYEDGRDINEIRAVTPNFIYSIKTDKWPEPQKWKNYAGPRINDKLQKHNGDEKVIAENYKIIEDGMSDGMKEFNYSFNKTPREK